MTSKDPGSTGHNMGNAARIKVYKEYKGSGAADPLPRRGGKFASIEGQLALGFDADPASAAEVTGNDAPDE